MATRRRRYLDADVQGAIEARAIDGLTPSQVLRDLERQPQYARRLPTLRTVQRIVKEAPKDQSAPWSLADSDGEDARLILETWQAAITTGMRRINITNAQAEWVLKIRKAAPGLSPYYVWLLAGDYRARAQRGENTEALDLFLAFRPWRDLDSRAWYEVAVQEGWVPKQPFTVAVLFLPNHEVNKLVDKHMEAVIEHGQWWRRVREAADEELRKEDEEAGKAGVGDQT